MPITGDAKRDKQIARGVILGVATQAVALIAFFAQLDARVSNLEDFMRSGDRFTSKDGAILEQRLDFYIGEITEIKSELKHISTKIDELR